MCVCGPWRSGASPKAQYIAQTQDRVKGHEKETVKNSTCNFVIKICTWSYHFVFNLYFYDNQF